MLRWRCSVLNNRLHLIVSSQCRWKYWRKLSAPVGISGKRRCGFMTSPHGAGRMDAVPWILHRLRRKGCVKYCFHCMESGRRLRTVSCCMRLRDRFLSSMPIHAACSHAFSMMKAIPQCPMMRLQRCSMSVFHRNLRFIMNIMHLSCGSARNTV